ncbi:MAG: SiaB family protein kinase [Bacteroidota bacterium]
MGTVTTPRIEQDKFLYGLFKDLGDYSLSYIYRGNFNPQLSDRILALAETNMNITGESQKTQKRVYFVMVESLQNITRHQDTKAEDDNTGFFVVQSSGKEHRIATGNVIDSDQVDALRGKLEMVNSLDQDTLKSYYKEMLSTTRLSEKGGAGLGLIEMARKTGNKLAFDFQSISDHLAYFYFQARITPEWNENPSAGTLDYVKEIHRLTRERHISLIYQGFFTHDNLKSLLSMTEGSVVSSEDLAFKRKSVNVMIELLQNICNHAASIDASREGKPGILLVTTEKEGCSLAAGNYIHTAQVQKLAAKIDRVNRSSDKELDDFYAETMMTESEPGARGAGLGFIDMKIKTGNNLDYAVMPVDDKVSFLSLRIKVNR